MQLKRGDICYIDSMGTKSIGSEQGGNRPAIIISNNIGNKHSSVVEVVYLTGAVKNRMPTHVQINSVTKIHSTALCEQIDSISKSRIRERWGCVTKEEQEQIDKALMISIGLKEQRKDENMSELAIIEQREVLGKYFKVYGDFENPLFLARDVAEWIDYNKDSKGFYDVAEMIRTVDDEEKCKIYGAISTANNVPSPENTAFTATNRWFLKEDGLYEVLMLSRKPIAKQFKKKVKEILKDIRKHGMYARDEILDNPDLLIQVATALKEEREKTKTLKTEIQTKNQLIGELKPKADYTDLILNSKSLVTITQIAKDYGMSGTAMNKLLHDLGVLYKQNEQWLLYSNYHARGFTHSETIDITHIDGRPDTRMHTKWTQKGRLFLYEKLKSNGILPMIEKTMAG